MENNESGASKEETKKEYLFVWRNKNLTDGCKTVAEMSEVLLDAGLFLQEMAERGVELSDNEDDWAFLITEDEQVADEFGFDEIKEEVCEECGGPLGECDEEVDLNEFWEKKEDLKAEDLKKLN